MSGKISKNRGSAFELKVRKDLEEKGWIVAKWSNNVETGNDKTGWLVKDLWKLIPAKNKFNPFNKAMMLGAGFPDFIAFKDVTDGFYKVCGVEAKSNGISTKLEKEKCEWLLKNNIFEKIFIAKRIKVGRKIEVEYNEFK